jgi:hypothetical protein
MGAIPILDVYFTIMSVTVWLLQNTPGICVVILWQYIWLFRTFSVFVWLLHNILNICTVILRHSIPRNISIRNGAHERKGATSRVMVASRPKISFWPDGTTSPPNYGCLPMYALRLKYKEVCSNWLLLEKTFELMHFQFPLRKEMDPFSEACC